MSEGTSNSLINLGGMATPADTLIKKVSKAVGGLFEPYQIVRVAKAEAEASLIKAKGELAITDLRRRAIHRFVDEEAGRQKNIEDITSKAIPQLIEGAKPDSMEDDWVTNFFDKSRIVSDGEMQNLWSRVLAGESNAPGTYSKRTVNFLSDLDKTDAELFSKLCGFGWMVGNVVPLMFDTKAGIYTKNGVNLNALIHLESIGLIQFNSVTSFMRSELQKWVKVAYYGRSLWLEMPQETDNMLDIGHVLLTKVGQELAPISGGRPVDGFWDYVVGRWHRHLPAPKDGKGPHESASAS